MSAKILVIEDDFIIAQGLKENLLDLGYQGVKVAPDSDAAIRIAANINPDLCIVDINLSKSPLNGIDLVYILRVIHDIPYIFLTSLDDKNTRSKALKTNPAAYLIKPISKEQIAVTIDLAMTNHFKLKEAIDKTQKNARLYGNDNKIFIKSGERYVGIEMDDIVYIKAEGSYCTIYTSLADYLISLTLGKVVDQLSSNFIRTHKSYAVSERHILSFNQSHIFLEISKRPISIPISRNQKDEINKRLTKIK